MYISNVDKWVKVKPTRVLYYLKAGHEGQDHDVVQKDTAVNFTSFTIPMMTKPLGNYLWNVTLPASVRTFPTTLLLMIYLRLT